ESDGAGHLEHDGVAGCRRRHPIAQAAGRAIGQIRHKKSRKQAAILECLGMEGRLRFAAGGPFFGYLLWWVGEEAAEQARHCASGFHVDSPSKSTTAEATALREDRRRDHSIIRPNFRKNITDFS